MILILFLVFCTVLGAESSCEKWGTFATILGCDILEEVSEANLVPEYQRIFDMLKQGEISAWIEKKREPAHKLVDNLSEYLLNLERFGILNKNSLY